MKNLFKVTFVALMTAVMVSCGGASEDNFIGQWTPDLTSVDFNIHDDLADEMPTPIDKAEIKSQLKEVQPMASMVKIDFKEDGTLTLGAMDDTQDFKWTVDGDNLVIKGEVPEGEFKGKEVELAFEILESTAEEFTIKISALSIKEQLEAQYKDEMEEAMKEAGDMKGLLNDDVLSNTWASITFKKKGAS